MNRRTFLKRGLASLITALGLSGSGYVYARNIEPFLLQIKKESIRSHKIPSSFNGFKIVQFSDTHIGFHYGLEQLNKLVSKINNLKPDIIVFTGDLVDEPNKYNNHFNLQEILSKLQAGYGKYWIYGNHDHGGYGTDIINNVMEQSGFNLLQNSHTLIENGNDRFILAGIDDVMLGDPDIHAALNNANDELFTILLSHEPDFADYVSSFPVDVQFSGHSHGGQVRLPFIGHLYTPDFAQKYVQGKYQIKDSDLTLFVNSGIGTTRLPYRFLCKPEVHLYTLERS
ncbi:metallophosphoesterase [Oceanobacillus piezotolerans]|uniref:Metallophosphoesterase n=1 Tax=Oceanobacillus piezotolerans TaxID=2448030 RepID=A0A498D6V4_9BACI|nr:metallophosphoesterase [Oceanobacillus piezotolerans]RLL45176.1 metallophosphoesterase [Oceanobacillus piezotolerans]